MKSITLAIPILLYSLLAGYSSDAQITGSADKRGTSKGHSFPRTDTFLSRLLDRYPLYFDTLLANPARRIQIIYTKIDRQKDNQPRFTHYYYNLDPGLYFYPASTVKFPAAVLALQKLNELKVRGLTKYSTMITGSATAAQSSVYNDPSSADGRPTIAHYIKKILLVSDNDAFNRIYEFLGQEYLNRKLHTMGYDSVQLLHRLDILLPEEENRLTNPVQFFSEAGKRNYQQPAAQSKMKYQKRRDWLGVGYMRKNERVDGPFDFSAKNRLPLQDLHTMLQSVLFPESVPPKKRLKLTPDDYRLIYTYMSLQPQQSTSPQYDSSYPNNYVKFLFYGAQDTAQPGILIFNKVGEAYGFLTDAAYIIDTIKGVEFLLSATIHCNSDGIYNDDAYEYETVGLPFMKNLGQVIYEYELDRPRKYKPDFRKFLIPW
jgi:hypothetical protein